MGEFILDLINTLFNSNVRVSPDYWLSTLLIAFVVYVLWRKDGRVDKGFWAWLLPKRIWRHKSTRLDIQLFVLNQLLIGLGLISRISLATAMAVLVTPIAEQGFGPLPENGARVPVLALTLILWLVTDFMIYLLHRIFHEVPRIWPIHAVHHSAEVMTPITAYRQHPLSMVFNAFTYSVVIGGVQGLLIGTLAPATTIATIAGINAFTALFNLAFANFHHSHIWLKFPAWLEYVLISPAQHQIHHSTRPEHYNKNYGDSLAIWDTAFGTLMRSEGIEQPPIGLTDPADAPLMSHRFWPVMIDPALRVFWPRKARELAQAYQGAVQEVGPKIEPEIGPKTRLENTPKFDPENGHEKREP